MCHGAGPVRGVHPLQPPAPEPLNWAPQQQRVLCSQVPGRGHAETPPSVAELGTRLACRSPCFPPHLPSPPGPFSL